MAVAIFVSRTRPENTRLGVVYCYIFLTRAPDEITTKRLLRFYYNFFFIIIIRRNSTLAELHRKNEYSWPGL